MPAARQGLCTISGAPSRRRGRVSWRTPKVEGPSFPHRVTSKPPRAGRLLMGPGLGRRGIEGMRVLELEGLSKRYGDVVALDGLTFPVGRARCSGSSGPTARARPPPCASCSASWSQTPARCAGRADRSTRRSGAGSGTCRRSAGSTRRCACVSTSSTSPSCTGPIRSAPASPADRWMEELGVS